MKKRILLFFIALLIVQTVSAEMKAEDFQVSLVQVQLGKTLTLSGSITNSNDEPVTGSATVYFKTEGEEYYANNVAVSEGKLVYSYKVLDNQPGEYSVDVLVKDDNSNEKLFENVARFTVLDEVRILVDPIQKKLLPGSAIPLSGEVSTFFGEKINKGIIRIILDDETYSSDVEDEKFYYNLELSEKIKTGEHVLKFYFFDEETGNRGSAERKIYVEAIPTEIKLSMFQKSVKPEDVLEAAIYVYDQAGDEIEDDVKVELVDSDDKSIYLNFIESVKKLTIEIPKYSVPGVWKLTAVYSGLKAEKGITVEEVKSAEINIVGQMLYIKNTGNVKYDEPVSVDLNDGEFKLTKSVSVQPGETLTIDLSKETPSGDYNIKVTGATVGTSQFDNVVIKGKDKMSLNFIYSGLLIFVITSLVYLTLFKKRHFRNAEVKTQKELRYAQKNLRKLRELKGREEPRRPVRFSREEGIADFRKRILRDIKDTEEKMKYKSYDSDKEDDDKPKGLFNMFD